MDFLFVFRTHLDFLVVTLSILDFLQAVQHSPQKQSNGSTAIRQQQEHPDPIQLIRDRDITANSEASRSELGASGAVCPTPSSEPSEPKILLRRTALAAALDCSMRTIDNLQADGMPCVFIGRSRRFILSEVIAWLKRKGGRP